MTRVSILLKHLIRWHDLSDLNNPNRPIYNVSMIWIFEKEDNNLSFYLSTVIVHRNYLSTIHSDMLQIAGKTIWIRITKLEQYSNLSLPISGRLFYQLNYPIFSLVFQKTTYGFNQNSLLSFQLSITQYPHESFVYILSWYDRVSTRCWRKVLLIAKWIGTCVFW